MKDTFIEAKLVSFKLIRIAFLTSLPFERFYATLLIDHSEERSLCISRFSSAQGNAIAEIALENPLEFGHSYFIKTNYGLSPLNINEATDFEGFDEKFDATKEELGSFYKREETLFSLYAPLASSVTLKIKKPHEEKAILRPLQRKENGVYSLALKGDWKNAEYVYLIVNSEVLQETIDSYAKASTANGLASVVLDESDFSSPQYKESLKPLKNNTEAIIYEGSVRDLTISPNTNIVHKGKYLGLAEEDRRTKMDHKAGLSYFQELGFTHLQLMPLYDFKTVDELHPDKNYNWGYDPAQYFVPEGSYASDPNDPLSRIKDLKTMMDSLHKHGIRVVMDVVFNHVYEWQMSSFEKTVPNFYFRKKENGQLSNASGCGNVFFSERPMVQKLIFEAAKWWIDFYGVDGFRFDLMGLIDVETIRKIENYAKEKDPSFMIYGEGWNMGGDSKVALASMNNAKMLPEVGFFNDGFREVSKRFFGGDLSDREAFHYYFLGSSDEKSNCYPKFLSPRQSVNYVECHDNRTYYDYLHYSKNIADEKELLSRSRLALGSILFSFGIPFIHAGEEIAQTKYGKDNTYNAGDDFNEFDYSLLDKRYSMALYFKDCILLRKKLSFLSNPSLEEIRTFTKIENVSNGLRIKFSGDLGEYEEVNLFFNPSNDSFTYMLDRDQDLLLMDGDALPVGIKAMSVLIPKCSLLVVALKKAIS